MARAAQSTTIAERRTIERDSPEFSRFVPKLGYQCTSMRGVNLAGAARIFGDLVDTYHGPGMQAGSHETGMKRTLAPSPIARNPI